MLASVRHNFWMLAAFLRHGQVLLLKIVVGWGKKKSAFSLKENPERQMGESRSVRQSHFCSMKTLKEMIQLYLLTMNKSQN